MKTKHILEMPRNNDINGMSNEELQMTYAEIRTTYMTDKGNTTRGMNPPPGRMRESRRTIARILTVMRKRGISPMKIGDEQLKNPAIVSE
jgi:ribosomal protein L29